MADEAVQTPQGEVGASDGGQSQDTPAEEPRTSLLGGGAEGGEAEGGEGEQGSEEPVQDANNKDNGEDGEKSEGDGEDGDKGDDDVPEEYAPFEVAEGIELDEAALGKATPVFKELGLSQDNAQKLINLQTELVQDATKQQMAKVDKLRDDWQAEIKADPDHPKLLADAKKAIGTFGDDGVKALMDSWIGDHPSMVRFLGNIGAAIGNDKFIEGQGGVDTSSRLDRIYDKMG